MAHPPTLLHWVEEQEAQGRSTFTRQAAHNALPHLSDAALHSAFSRLTRARRVVSVRRGTYAVLPATHRSKGILPGLWLVDALVSTPYYLALLSAAALHGAGHHAAQEMFVITTYPAPRDVNKQGLAIQFIPRRQFPPREFLERRNTPTGQIWVSSPALTAADLVYYQSNIGGLNRAANVLAEMAESLQPRDFGPEFVQILPSTTVQRLGYLLAFLQENELEQALYDSAQQCGFRFHWLNLSPDGTPRTHSNRRWRVRINIDLDPEF